MLNAVGKRWNIEYGEYMKLFQMAMLLSTAVSVYGQSYLHSNSIINLNVKMSSISFDVRYPGYSSGVCGLRIVTSVEDMQTKDQLQLMDLIEVREGEMLVKGEVSEHMCASPSYSFERHMPYVTEISIKTKDGGLLSDAINLVTKNYHVESPKFSIVALPCS